jgi:hypothetical protein
MFDKKVGRWETMKNYVSCLRSDPGFVSICSYYLPFIFVHPTVNLTLKCREEPPRLRKEIWRL